MSRKGVRQFMEALGGDVAEKGLERPGALSVTEVLATGGWFNERSKRSVEGCDDLLAFIVAYQEEHGYSPSYREMKEGLSLGSTHTVSRYLGLLKAAGMIDWKAGFPRTVRITNDNRGNVG